MKMKQKAAQTLLALWAILCVAALADYLDALATVDIEVPFTRGELETKLSLEMVVLSAPISILVLAMDPILPGDGPVAEWLWLAFAGFVQWGTLVPAVAAKFRRVAAELDEKGES